MTNIEYKLENMNLSIFNEKFIIIFIIVLMLSSCVDKKFQIKLDNNDYKQIHNLIIEIYNKAMNNEIDYFRNAIGNSFNKKFASEEEKIEYCNILREINQKEYYSDEEILEYERKTNIDHLKKVYKKENYNDDEFIEYYAVEEIQSLINNIIKVNIVKTYRSRAEYSNNGINFNYHWNEKDVYFQMYIVKYWDDYISENAYIGGGIQDWKLYSLWTCR
jgi:hypothetical protein